MQETKQYEVNYNFYHFIHNLWIGTWKKKNVPTADDDSPLPYSNSFVIFKIKIFLHKKKKKKMMRWEKANCYSVW